MVKKYSLVMDTHKAGVITDAVILLAALVQKQPEVFIRHTQVIASALAASDDPHGYGEDTVIAVLKSIEAMNNDIDADDAREAFFHD